MAELCLGTVQFGMRYGINNTLGQPAEEKVFEMLDTAIEGGIRVIDTARAYGTAELLLGRYFENRKHVDSLQIISKLRPNIIPEHMTDCYSIVRKELEESLKRLHLSCLDGYLLHTPEYIYHPEIVKSLQKLKAERLVKHIGASIYGLKEGYAALETEGVDYIQLPYSILDQRGIQDGFIQKAKKKGMVIFTRSAFLQGLFLMEKEHIPDHLRHVIPYLIAFEKLVEKYKVEKTEALLQFVNQEKNIDYLVFGIDTKEQLQQNIQICKKQKIPDALLEEIKHAFVDIEKSIIFPSLWANGKQAE